MADNDKQYINYNLSLIDAKNIVIETPAVNKADIKIDIETPDEVKLDQDITAYVTNEDKPADGGSLPINWFAQLGLAREFPLEPVESDIEVKQNIPEQDRTTNFKVTDTNKGKDTHFAELTPSSYIDVKVLKDQDQDSTIASSFRTTQVSSPATSKKDDDIDIGGPSPVIEVKVLKEAGLNTEKGTALNPTEKDSFESKKVSEGVKLKDDNTIDIMDLSPFTSGSIAKSPYTQEELTYDNVIAKLNVKGDVTNLGSIHVYPANPNDEGGILSKYVIPFEFNPVINESGRAAKFEASSILSRTGDVQSYIKTDGMSVSLTTKYQVLTNTKAVNDTIDNKMKGDHQGVGSWMDSFHLRNVQSIEMAYRGLVFPQLSKTGGSFFRPPLIKIVFGKSGVADGQIATDVTPFNSLLTYPYKMADGTKIYHKSFIVTKVDIKKDWENMPVIMNENNDGIIDLQGFDVSLELIEVDPMYIGVLPSFEDYYSIAKNVGA